MSCFVPDPTRKRRLLLRAAALLGMVSMLALSGVLGFAYGRERFVQAGANLLTRELSHGVALKTEIDQLEAENDRLRDRLKDLMKAGDGYVAKLKNDVAELKAKLVQVEAKNSELWGTVNTLNGEREQANKLLLTQQGNLRQAYAQIAEFQNKASIMKQGHLKQGRR
jgi:chromosome segregation ATPase